MTISVAFFVRHGIVAGSSPGMTSRDSSDRQVTAFECAVAPQRITSVFGACGLIAAMGTDQGRNGIAVEPDQTEQRPGQQSAG